MPTDPKPKIKDNITSVEWMLVIIAAIVIDVAQYFFIPFILPNRVIDVGVGFLLLVYCFLRGLTNVRQIASIIATFGLEFMGPGDVLPLWTADMIVIMMWHKAELKAAARIPLANTALKARYMRRVARSLPFAQQKPSLIQPDLPGLELPPPSQTPPPLPRNTVDLRNPKTPPPLAPVSQKKPDEQLDLL